LKNKLPFLLFISLAVLSARTSFCQKKDSTWTGTVSGMVWDSAHTIVLRSATLAVYAVKDSALIGYTLSNNYGEFSIKALPVATPLKIVASFVGYKNGVKNFLIPSLKNELDLGHLSLTASAAELSEVTVTSAPPPVRMKGDTLEFNADAFKLDPNAQTEDLLRVLPGITVWADGTITVYGREVSSVLVNGKPFFGGDARVATQNIPKNAVDKIQVYQKDKNPRKPTLDSTAEINIKLKKGKEVGYFGKFSGGYGTGRHYESDGNLNFFNGRSQLGIAVSGNNINKIANDINFILRNNTFKGTGARVEYQSNYILEGVNKYTAGGLIFQHDFIPNADYYNNNRLTAVYFGKNNNQNLIKNTTTTTLLDSTHYFTQQDNYENNNTQRSQNANATYEKIKNGNTFSIDGNFKNEANNSTSKYASAFMDENQNLLSTNAIFNNAATNTDDAGITTTYKHKPLQPNNSWLSLYDISYGLNLTDGNINQNLKSVYTVPANQSQNRDLARIYNTTSTKLLHKLIFNLPNFGAVIFKNYRFAGIITGLKNDAEITAGKERTHVKDLDNFTNKYQSNSYLTNNRRETIFNIKPALTFTKSIYKSLSNRYSKSFSADLSIGPQFYNLNSSSEKTFQQFSRAWQNFVPKANFAYTNQQYGSFTNSGSLQIAASSQYPTMQQLAPLEDSANLNFIQKGNLYLKEQDTREVTLNFRHSSEKGKNILTWSLTLNAGYIKNYFANSSSIDSLGRSVYTIVNANGYRYSGGSADIKKAFKIKNSQLQFSFSPGVSINRSPNYINGIFNYFYNFSLSYNPAVNYTYKDWLAVNIIQKQSYNSYSQKGSNTIDITNLVSQSEGSFSINCTKKLSLSSNVIYTKNTYNRTQKTTFTIWNASAVYRMFDGNNAELKFSALDLLHQNTGLINYGFNNSVTQGKVNVLQQYFMLTLAWFPRKFGK